MPRRCTQRRRRGRAIRRREVQERAYLVGWASTRRSRLAPGAPEPEKAIRELSELATSAGAHIAGSVLQRSPEPDPATLVGRGKVREIRDRARSAQADLVIFDHDLSPSQLRNLEQAFELKVIDRTQLILDIFARRARSREGQLQVELAQLNYLLPRLAGRGTMLSRLGGGIGTRGPGEQKLEYDRRRIRGRIRTLGEAIERVRTHRAQHRARRRERQFLTVALVGYTNAGKSTLFNALTHSDVVTSPRLFATLDPTVRALDLESRRRVLLSDAVGFIHKLPAHLVAAFRATIEELENADLLLHVSDASHSEREQQEATVEQMLETLGIASTPRLHVWNKIDLLDARERRRLSQGLADIPVSARTGQGLEALVRRVDEALAADPVVELTFELPPSDVERRKLLHRLVTVVETAVEDERVRVRVRLKASQRGCFFAKFPEAEKRNTDVLRHAS